LPVGEVKGGLKLLTSPYSIIASLHQENVWDVSSGEACFCCVGKKTSPSPRDVFFQPWFLISPTGGKQHGE
jgi:hypothetical protein